MASGRRKKAEMMIFGVTLAEVWGKMRVAGATIRAALEEIHMSRKSAFYLG
jgi:hypothetical protein